MLIQIDTREKAKIIKPILDYFDKNGIKYISSKLYVADYMNFDNPKIVVDRKHNLSELCANLSDVPKKDKQGRFKRDKNGRIMSERLRFLTELEKAKEAEITVIVLCEHGGKIKTLEDVQNWINPRLKDSPLTMSGIRLYKLLNVLQNSDKYSVRFEFCDKRSTGRRIAELLSEH